MKTVYILGAGCSVEDGVPLVNDFLNIALETKRKLSCEGDRKRFDNVFIFRNKEIPNSNIEELFSYIDFKISMCEPFDRPTYKSIRNDLLFLIGQTISKNIIKGSSHNYNLFKSRLRGDSTVITFNWDILLDNHLTANILEEGINTEVHLEIDYGGDFFELYKDEVNNRFNYRDVKRKGIKLLKLHGSFNWLFCKDNIRCMHRFFVNGNKVQFELFKGKTYTCPACNKVNLLPLIVPPSFEKNEQMWPLSDIWQEAENELINCEKIVIIGYSFPNNDVHSKLFLQSCISKNFHKNKRPIKVDIVNYKEYLHEKEDFEKHYSNVLYNVKEYIRPNFKYEKFSEHYSFIKK
ncbi:MAG: hypothetical protein ISS82_02160 [Nanoarchaeota archaeon]|nr:hypothetical protein [Nanoarchaeota archaeon]